MVNAIIFLLMKMAAYFLLSLLDVSLIAVFIAAIAVLYLIIRAITPNKIQMLLSLIVGTPILGIIPCFFFTGWDFLYVIYIEIGCLALYAADLILCILYRLTLRRRNNGASLRLGLGEAGFLLSLFAATSLYTYARWTQGSAFIFVASVLLHAVPILAYLFLRVIAKSPLVFTVISFAGSIVCYLISRAIANAALILPRWNDINRAYAMLLALIIADLAITLIRLGIKRINKHNLPQTIEKNST